MTRKRGDHTPNPSFSNEGGSARRSIDERPATRLDNPQMHDTEYVEPSATWQEFDDEAEEN